MTLAMSFPCTKCKKVYPSTFALEEHTNKKIPCNLECKSCNFIGRNRQHYYRHLTKHEQILEPEPESKRKSRIPNDVRTRTNRRCLKIRKEHLGLEYDNYKDVVYADAFPLTDITPAELARLTFNGEKPSFVLILRDPEV